MKRKSLYDKLKSSEYIKSLSKRRRREILICKELLTEEELKFFSSIDTAYHVARERYIKENYDKNLLSLVKKQRYPIRKLSELLP